MRGHSRVRSTLHGHLLACLVFSSACGEADRGSGPVREPFVPRPTTDRPGARRVVLLAEPGEVPGVAGQTTTRGRQIGTLVAHGARVHLGYGDYSNNTGPIVNIAYSVVDHEFVVGSTLSTEEVLDMVVHAGYLFAADLDPRGHEGVGSAFRLAEGASRWQELPDIEGAVHTFALAEFEGLLYTGTGSVLGDSARVVSSADAGLSWHTEHSTESPSDAYTRYTHLGATRSRLFVSGRVYAESQTAFAYTLTGGRWQRLQQLPGAGFLIPLTLGEELVVAQFSGDRGKGGEHVGSFRLDGELFVADTPFPAGWRLVNWSHERREEASERLWVVAEQDAGPQAAFLVQRLDDWQLIAELPELADADRFSSLCYLDNALYLGTQAGAMFVVEEVFEWAP